MAQIQALRGIRYDLGHIGTLGDVVAPPYDVISPAEQETLYKRHAANVIRLILNREEPGDDETSNRYTRAAGFIRDWQRQGLLQTEGDPALYVYHQQYDYAGASYTRRGFMARLRLERLGEGQVYPHEETMPGPKKDRLDLTRACRANLSPIFGLYPDPQATVQQQLDQAIVGKTPLQATDDLGVVHRLWPVTDVDAITAAVAGLGDKPVYIADGHHRYETACNYRDELAAAGSLPADHPAQFVLATMVGMNDPGMQVLPTHRLFRGLDPIDSDTLRAKLGDLFETRVVGEGSDLAASVWSEIESADEQGAIGLFAGIDERWLLARISDAGRAKMDELAADKSDQWRSLGVSILQRLIIEHALDAGSLPKPKYVHLVDEVVESLDEGNFPLAALVMPATLEHVRQISEHGERMPAKSTYFYPKLLSGLVINPLE